MILTLQVLFKFRKSRGLKSVDFLVQVGSYLWLKILSDYNVFFQNWDYRHQVLLAVVVYEYRDTRTIIWE